MKLPADTFELYTFAIVGVLRQALGPEEEGIARRMLRRVATANHLAQRRTFTLHDALAALSAAAHELALWARLMAGGAIPVVKILASDGDRSGEFQFKHLSFQEALFVEAIILGEVPQFWATDADAARHLNNAFYRNAFAIGYGYLGNALAKQRPVWDFATSESRLVMDDGGTRGWATLMSLVHGATSLVSLKVPLAGSQLVHAPTAAAHDGTDAAAAAAPEGAAAVQGAGGAAARAARRARRKAGDRPCHLAKRTTLMGCLCRSVSCVPTALHRDFAPRPCLACLRTDAARVATSAARATTRWACPKTIGPRASRRAAACAQTSSGLSKRSASARSRSAACQTPTHSRASARLRRSPSTRAPIPRRSWRHWSSCPLLPPPPPWTRPPHGVSSARQAALAAAAVAAAAAAARAVWAHHPRCVCRWRAVRCQSRRSRSSLLARGSPPTAAPTKASWPRSRCARWTP